MRLPFLLLCACLLVWHGTARAACTVQERTAVPFTLTGGHLLVPVTVNGIDASFVLDTGSQRSVVTPEAVQRLHLTLDKWVDTTMRGVGGIVEHANADPRSLTLGGVTLRPNALADIVSLSVGKLPSGYGGPAVDGLLGRDLLSRFDLQFDLAAHRLTLFAVHDCGGRFLPWRQPYAAVPATAVAGHALIVPITLDGHRLSALLDTGASATMVTLPGMMRLGLTEASMAAEPGAVARGIGPHARPMHRHRFASLEVGSETISRPVLWVAPVRVIPIVDALLGADWLAEQSRVWMSFATNQVFFIAR